MRIRGDALLTSLEILFNNGLPIRLFALASNNQLAIQDSSLLYTDAISLCVSGRAEGVATPSGRLKYLLKLSDAEFAALHAAVAALAADQFDPDGAGGGCLYPGNPRLGVYSEPVVSMRPLGIKDERGIEMVESQVIGHVYRHYHQERPRPIA